MHCIKHWILLAFRIICREQNIEIPLSLTGRRIIADFLHTAICHAGFFFTFCCRLCFQNICTDQSSVFLYRKGRFFRFFRLFCNRKFCNFRQYEILYQLHIRNINSFVLIYISGNFLCCAGESIRYTSLRHTKIKGIDHTIKIQIAENNVLCLSCTMDSRSADRADRLVNVEIIRGFSSFHIKLHLCRIGRNEVILIRKLHPFAFDSCALCNCGILCIAVCIGILKLEIELIRCCTVKICHIDTEAVFVSGNKCSWIKRLVCTVPCGSPILHKKCFTSYIGGSAACLNACRASCLP